MWFYKCEVNEILHGDVFNMNTVFKIMFLICLILLFLTLLPGVSADSDKHKYNIEPHGMADGIFSTDVYDDGENIIRRFSSTSPFNVTIKDYMKDDPEPEYIIVFEEKNVKEAEYISTFNDSLTYWIIIQNPNSFEITVYFTIESENDSPLNFPFLLVVIIIVIITIIIAVVILMYFLSKRASRRDEKHYSTIPVTSQNITPHTPPPFVRS